MRQRYGFAEFVVQMPDFFTDADSFLKFTPSFKTHIHETSNSNSFNGDCR